VQDGERPRGLGEQIRAKQLRVAVQKLGTASRAEGERKPQQHWKTEDGIIGETVYTNSNVMYTIFQLEIQIVQDLTVCWEHEPLAMAYVSPIVYTW